MSSRVRSSHEAMFASPVGISIFDGRIYVSDRARETVSVVDFDFSSERLLQLNVQQPGVLKVFTNSLSGKQRVSFLETEF